MKTRQEETELKINDEDDYIYEMPLWLRFGYGHDIKDVLLHLLAKEAYCF